ncbi:MAG TPA: hypothetical protein VKU00_30220 [Chthonomonadaceae bacterium]|nr:hypothetical protein [Chthonomonadaceae bacterium]
MRNARFGVAVVCVSLLWGCGGGSGGGGISPTNKNTNYVVTDLGEIVVNASVSTVLINNKSSVALVSVMAQTLPPTQEAFRVTNGAKMDLGTQASPLAINDLGQVLFPTAEYTGSGLVDYSSKFRTPGQTFQAAALNNNGQIAGVLSGINLHGHGHAAIYSSGGFTDLGVLAPYTDSQAVAINDAGQVACTTAQSPIPGNSLTTERSFLYSNGTITDLGSLGGERVDAYAINNAGQIVGVATIGPDPYSDTHAFLYTKGQMTDLGVLTGGQTSYAYSINTQGQAVGLGTTNGRSNPHAVFFTQGAVVDLNDRITANSGWELVTATGINDVGQIVGFGTWNGRQHGFLLTPQ